MPCVSHSDVMLSRCQPFIAAGPCFSKDNSSVHGHLKICLEKKSYRAKKLTLSVAQIGVIGNKNRERILVGNILAEESIRDT